MKSLKDSDSDFEDRRKFENIQKLWREVRSINVQPFFKQLFRAMNQKR
jgi:hypothetical protein